MLVYNFRGEPMIVIFGGTKGGVGKSTLATNIAAVEINNGHDSLLVDADKQGSSAAWAATREHDNTVKPVPCVQKLGRLSLSRELERLSRKYENILVDAGGYENPELRAAIVVADRLYIPLRPGQFDVWSLPHIEIIVKESRLHNERLRPFFVINGAHPNPKVKEVDEIKEVTQEIEDIPYCKTIIHYRRAFYKPTAGVTVTELKTEDGPDQRAKAEIMQFYKEIFHGN